MPLLTKTRSRRRIGELVAVFGALGALWGPVGPAEAGVSAGPPATASIGSSSTGNAVTQGSLVGTGKGAKQLEILKDPFEAQRLSCTPSWYATSLTTQLASSWSSLAARSQPCTSGAGQGTWLDGQSIKVTGYTDDGGFICRGGTYGYGTAAWYKTSKGWIWAGGTTSPRWDKSRNC
ncbi:MAG: hypothetical protein PGN13_12725 [Patulibacter minatonensis]